LGFEAATGIEAGIRRYVDWVLAEQPAEAARVPAAPVEVPA
jgi:hypothetical protein